MKPNAIKKKVGTLKYYLDQTISTSPTSLTDEQISEIILKYFTGLESSPNSKGKKYIKGARKTVTLTDGKTPTSMSLSTGATFKVSTEGDTITFTSDITPAKGDAAGVSSQYVHKITTTDGNTTHSFTQTRMVGDRPISQETFSVELPKGATFSKDNLVDIFVADSSYSQVDPLAPRIATPVQNKPVAIVPVTPTPVVQTHTNNNGESLTHIPRDIPLEYFLNGGRAIDQRLVRGFAQVDDSGIVPQGITNPIRQGEVDMAERPREEQGFNIVDDSGRIVRHGTRTNEMRFESLDDWAAVCREIETINQTRIAEGQEPLAFPQYTTTDEHGQPITHTYVEGSFNGTGLVPTGRPVQKPAQENTGLILRPHAPVTKPIVIEEFEDVSGRSEKEEEKLSKRQKRKRDQYRQYEKDYAAWEEECRVIDELNRAREAAGEQPLPYPKEPKEPGAFLKNFKQKLKPVIKTLGKVLKKVGKFFILLLVIGGLVVGGIKACHHINQKAAQQAIDDANKQADTVISETFTPDYGIIEDFEEEEDQSTSGEGGAGGGGGGGTTTQDPVVNPNVQQGDRGNPLKDPTAGDYDITPDDDEEDIYYEEDSDSDSSSTENKNKNKTHQPGAPANSEQSGPEQ